jgi:hypothetical protein
MQTLIYRDGSGGGTGKTRRFQWLSFVQPPALAHANPPRPVAIVQPFGAPMQVKLPLTLITLFCAFQPHSSENNVAGQGSARDMDKTLCLKN